jgi:hypothetical protein
MFARIKNQQYLIKYFAFKLEGDTGISHCEGMLKYTSVAKSKETADLNGPFKIYLSLRYGCWCVFYWCVFYFVLPGFDLMNEVNGY